ncbi:MAG TPA: hypothetical protein VI912_04165 [Candidatus Bilamarchaeaceae archaeon]|nr:hypothetical protein [Candidatus Bilamarchaeaceae archaeon]
MRTSKYGAKNRKKVDSTYKSKKTLYECRDCKKKKVASNQSFSVWRCRSCGKVYAGGAYTFRTSSGIVCDRLMKEYEKTG